MNGSDAFLIEAIGYSNAILCDAGSIFDAIEFDFPILGSKINWELVPDSVERANLSINDCKDFFSEATVVAAVESLTYVGDGLTSVGVTAEVMDFAAALLTILELPQHHYFYDPANRFCITFTMEGDMHYGFAPPARAKTNGRTSV